MRRWVWVLWMVGLAVQDVGAAEGAEADEADRASGVGIEFYDDEVDWAAEFPPDSPQAEQMRMLQAMTPRVHNIIRSKVVSPNGQRVVYIVGRDSGATTVESLQAFLGRPASPDEERQFNEKMLGVQIFRGEKWTTQVRGEWKDDQHLVIYSDGEAEFSVEEHEGVSIRHELQ